MCRKPPGCPGESLAREGRARADVARALRAERARLATGEQTLTGTVAGIGTGARRGGDEVFITQGHIRTGSDRAGHGAALACRRARIVAANAVDAEIAQAFRGQRTGLSGLLFARTAAVAYVCPGASPRVLLIGGNIGTRPRGAGDIA